MNSNDTQWEGPYTELQQDTDSVMPQTTLGKIARDCAHFFEPSYWEDIREMVRERRRRAR